MPRGDRVQGLKSPLQTEAMTSWAGDASLLPVLSGSRLREAFDGGRETIAILPLGPHEHSFFRGWIFRSLIIGRKQNILDHGTAPLKVVPG